MASFFRLGIFAVAISAGASCAPPAAIPTPCCAGSLAHFGAPRGWLSVLSSGRSNDVGLIDTGAHGGRYSAAIIAWDTTASGAGITQVVSAQRYRGKRVRLSAWLRETANTNRDNVLWVTIADNRDDAAWTSAALDSMAPSRENAFGLSPWQLRQIVIDVPADATAIGFGVLLVDGPFEPERGPGPHALFADDFRLDVVDTRMALAGNRSDVITEFTSRLNFSAPAPAPTNLDFELMK